MEDRLRYILSTVNEWLKFAEAKNGALLGVDIAIIFGLFQVISDEISKGWIYLAIVFTGLSALSALFSFVPQLKAPSMIRQKRGDKETSLIFYGHIAKYEPEGYIKALYSTAGTEVPSNLTFELDYAYQIIINSRIALKKNRYFNIGLWLTVLGLLLLIITLLLFLRT